VSTHRVVHTEAELPQAWDAIAACYFQKREFLRHAEFHNPCRQRYHWLERDGRPFACAVVYSLPLDLLTFAGLRSPLQMQLVGLPCSVSAPGVFGETGGVRELVEQLLAVERGLVVGLNLEVPLALGKALDGRTLPTVVLQRRFDSFEGYLSALRADYRRRLRRVRGAWAQVEVQRGECAAFDDEAYALYIQVISRSRARLETLQPSFFSSLPESFKLTRYRRGGRLLGWHICLADEDRFYFFMGGVDGAGEERLTAYLNLLLGVLQDGIAAGARTIDFGQTAEVPKSRLGGELVERHLFAHHRSALVRALLKLGRGALEYTTQVPQAHVFRAGAVSR
jgi:hypothetical protein